MTPEQLQQANKINGQIALIDDMEKDIERFKKTRFSGALPTTVTRFIASDSSIALEVVERVWDMAMMKRIELTTQLNAL